jgi:uncharacterized RDD family membrane protein YckC
VRAVAASPGAQPIITPEAVVLDFERAGAASRTIAFAIDALALTATLVVLVVASVAVLGDSAEGTGAALFAVFTSLGMVIVWFTAFETLWRGRTLGKAAMGLRVISADGTTVRFQQAFLRAAVGLVDFFLVPIGFVAVVTVLLSPRDQRLGDMAAGTLVVRERSASQFVAPAWFPAPRGWERYAASLDVAAIDERTYGLVRSYLLRVHELTAGARDHLAVRLANPVAVKMGHKPPSYVHPHLFLVCVAAAWQQAHGGNPYQPGFDPRRAPMASSAAAPHAAPRNGVPAVPTAAPVVPTGPAVPAGPSSPAAPAVPVDRAVPAATGVPQDRPPPPPPPPPQGQPPPPPPRDR